MVRLSRFSAPLKPPSSITAEESVSTRPIESLLGEPFLSTGRVPAFYF